jgi:hypothetical protein
MQVSYLDLADRILAQIQNRAELNEGGTQIDGHHVRRVIWQTDKAVIFEDPDGHFWRYLHDWRQSWPVIVTSRKESA